MAALDGEGASSVFTIITPTTKLIRRVSHQLKLRDYVKDLSLDVDHVNASGFLSMQTLQNERAGYRLEFQKDELTIVFGSSM